MPIFKPRAVLAVALGLGLAIPVPAVVAQEREPPVLPNPEPEKYDYPGRMPQRLEQVPGAQRSSRVHPNVYRDLLGLPVLTAEGQRVGVVRDVLFDTVTDRAAAALVDLAVAQGEPWAVAVPWPTLTLMTEANVLVTELTPEDLVGLPRIDPEQPPAAAYKTFEEEMVEEALEE